MAGITSAGVGSGLDLEAIISVTVDAENLPKVARFDKSESAVDLQLTALGQMNSDLSKFQDTVDILKDLASFDKRTATVTQPDDSGDVISVVAASSATAGSFEIDVQQVAQGSRAVQEDASAYAATTDVVSAAGGTLTFTAGAKTFDLAVTAGATLAELRDAINDDDNNFGISANIINTGTVSKLVLTSSETGAGNDLVISNNNAELDQVSTLANAGGAGGMAIAAVDAAQDAIIEIDGIQITNATNTFTDAIQDTTITVLKESPEDPDNLGTNKMAKLDVATDTEFVKETLEKFVSSFNGIIGTLNTVTTSKTADTTARAIRNALLGQVGNIVAGAGDLTSIYDMGLKLTKSNTLEFDATAVNTLDDALTNSYNDIGTLFAGAGGIGEAMASTLDLYLGSGGLIKDEQDALKEEKSDIGDERRNHAYRMELFENRLREKYANLDVLIASMRSQGSAISSSLSNLPGFTREK